MFSQQHNFLSRLTQYSHVPVVEKILLNFLSAIKYNRPFSRSHFGYNQSAANFQANSLATNLCIDWFLWTYLHSFAPNLSHNSISETDLTLADVNAQHCFASLILSVVLVKSSSRRYVRHHVYAAAETRQMQPKKGVSKMGMWKWSIESLYFNRYCSPLANFADSLASSTYCDSSAV